MSERTVFKKLAQAVASVGVVGKDGTNAHFKYSYQAWDDILPVVKQACVDAGICLIPSLTVTETQGKKTFVTMTVEIVDAENGDTHTIGWAGEADDAQDKGVQKAGTSAFKYLMLKLFQIVDRETVKDDTDGQAPVPEVIRALNHQQIKSYVSSLELTTDEYAVIRDRCVKFKVPIGTFLGECRHDHLTDSREVIARLNEEYPLSPSDASMAAQEPNKPVSQRAPAGIDDPLLEEVAASIFGDTGGN